jgi:EAL domain-containing protein (putative c-di-GMP-specific phosphodiesterase class I)
VLIQATVLVARALGIHTVAEGVETQEQAHVLDELGCSMAQGYLYGHPMAVDEFEQWQRPRLAFAAA